MIHYRKDTNNIVTLILDMSGRFDNIINHEIGAAFVPVIEHLQREKRTGALKGVILTSEKKTFLAGGGLESLYYANDPAELLHASERLKAFLSDLERPGVPVVAAINGNALGTGFEVALACHHRIVLDNPKIRLGHPEVNLGLTPSGGAILRLMWLEGIESAYTFLSKGLRYSPQEALKAGIIDDLANTNKEMLEKAKAWILDNRNSLRPWQRPGAQIPGGTAHDPDVAERISFLTAELSAQTQDNYPARRTILNVLSEGSKVDFQTAQCIDSRHFAYLVCTKACKNMISTFWFDQKAIKSGLNRPKGYGKFRPKKVGIVGSGLMGSGIAFACIRNGLEVVIKDVSRLIAERGREFAAKKLDQLIQQGTFQPSELEELLSRITTTEHSSDFANCDLVIEAVFENKNVKQKVTREAEEHLDEYSLLASNTVSIPITQLAESSLRPNNYVGLHFFPPADEVPLVEIVRGAKTSDESVARAFDFVIMIKKIPIVVKDDWGFFAARVQNTYILEGITLLKEGYTPALIENLGVQAGLPKGPLRFADDVGLPLVLRYEEQAALHYGEKYIQHPAVPLLAAMVEEHQRLGRYKQTGFYNYPAAATPKLWPELTEHFPITQTAYDRREITERLLIVQVIEAIWCMQEGVIHSSSAANLGSVYGWGFPAYKGGVIRYIYDYGPSEFMARCEELHKQYGQRFRVPRLLRQLVANQDDYLAQQLNQSAVSVS